MATDEDMVALLALSSGDDDSDNDDSDTKSFTMIDAFIAVAATLSSDDDEFEEGEEEDEAEVEKPDTMMMVEKPPILGRWWRKRVTKPRTLRYQQPVLEISKGERRAREEELWSSKKKASVATTSYEDQGISWEERRKRESMLKKPVEVEEKRVDKNKGVKNILSIDLNQVFKEEGMSTMDEYMKLEWSKRDQIQVFKNGDKNKASTSTVKNILAFDLNKDFKEESMSSRDDEYMEQLLNTDLKVFKNGTKRVLSRSKREGEEEEHKSATKKRKTGNIKKNKGPGLGSGCSRRDYPGPDPPPSLPAEVRILIENESGGAVEKEPVLVIQKKLTKTDLSNRHNRLAVPVLQVKGEFLTEKEKEFLKKKKENADKMKKTRENKTETIGSRIIMPSLWRADITLCRWEMKKGDGKAGCELYVLIGAWNKLRENEKTIEFELEPNMVVQLWAYRVNGCLRFALVNLGKFEPGSSSRSASGNSTTNPPHDSRCEDGREDQN